MRLNYKPMRKPNPYRVESLLVQLTQGATIKERVAKGVAHFKKLGMLGKVGVCRRPANEKSDSDYFERMKIQNEKEAYDLGLRGRTSTEVSLLYRTWQSMLVKN